MLTTTNLYMQSTNCRVIVVGNQPALQSVAAAEVVVQQVTEHELSICLMYPARDNQCQGFQKVVPFRADTSIHADATILTEKNCAVVFQVADCPGLILEDEKSGTIGVAHAGRAAITPCGKLEQNIVSKLLQQMNYLKGSSLAQVTALITPHISPSWFRHNFNDDAKALVRQFQEWHDRYPWAGIITDEEALTLDMKAFIATQLQRHYSKPKDIIAHKSCTFETGGLASRRHDTTHKVPEVHRRFNTCIVYRR